ncbi:extracellular solute-binding protein [Vibrio sp. WXL210]|uniref:extracellular solute-binding protein n=1 Tax=Vibrio sp. WXL210 TaxID=3450709 RepID=UPI003EC62440
MGKLKQVILGVSVSFFALSAYAEDAQPSVIETDRLVGFGEAKYPADFSHFDYVNPDAPKYGKVTYGQVGTYDNFNRYASRGVAAAATGQLYDTLMFSPADEVDAYYPLIAEKVRYASDFSWLEVDINPKAVFQDGEPITAEDIEFTFQTFMTQGVPQYRVYYQDISSVKALSERTARIEMDNPNREKLFSLAQSMTVLPKHFWQGKDFSEPLDTPPVGSGPYLITDYKSGQSLTYSLNPDYWAKDLPVNVGRYNFAQIQYDYYRDETVMLEAFKAGEFDFREESSAKFWANSYTGANFDRGYIKKEEIPHSKPTGTQALVFNIQKPMFADPKVREALNYALDFEWMNSNMFYSQYQRTRSYFQNTDYEATDLPSAEEKALLEPFGDKIPPRVYSDIYQPPVTDGTGRIRAQMRAAFALLKEAGWELQNKVMTNVETGEPMSFELLIYSPTTERIAIPVQKNLKRMGIEMRIRTIDTTQYIKRLRERDFDMVSSAYPAFTHPSPDMMIVWHSSYIDSTYNRAGVEDPVVDAFTLEIAQNQENPEKLLSLGRALDRYLQWNFYIIPQWHSNLYRVATWDKFERPEITPKYDLGVDTWWVSKTKAQKLPQKRQ